MGTNRRSLRLIIRTIEQGPERSPLFWYLLKHHDELARAAAGTRIRWGPLCEQFAADGLFDGSGKVPTAKTARSTWLNVRREVVRRLAAKSAVKPPPNRSPRLPQGWTPPVAVPAPPVRPFAPPPGIQFSDVVNNEDCTGEESLAGLRRILAERSGR